MATNVFDRIKFCEQFSKKTSKETFLPSLVRIGPLVLEEKIFKENVEDGRSTTPDGNNVDLKAPVDHVVLT